MITLRKLLLSFALVFVAAGCSWFGSDDDEPQEIEPNPLPSIQEEVELSVVWSSKIGKGAEDRAVRIKPAVMDTRIYGASADGIVKAHTTESGREIWSRKVKSFYSKEEIANAFSKDLDIITGGVGVGGDLVVVGAGSGDLIALNQSDGSLAWRVPTSSEVLSPPLVDQDRVFAQSIDGKITAYDAIDGRSLWVYTTNTPALTMRGTARPILYNDLIIVGFANGRVAFLDREKGIAKFDQRIGIAQGTTDLERLVDIDGAMQIHEGKLYVASFQGRIAAIDVSSGRMLWADDLSSLSGVGTGFGNVYAARADSRLTAFDAANGREIWNIDALLYRDITAPVSVGSFLLFTDFEGYAHIVAQSDGRFVGRRKIDSRGVKAGLVSEGRRIYALTDGGSLIAIEIR